MLVRPPDSENHASWQATVLKAGSDHIEVRWESGNDATPRIKHFDTGTRVVLTRLRDGQAEYNGRLATIAGANELSRDEWVHSVKLDDDDREGDQGIVLGGILRSNLQAARWYLA